MVSGTAGLPLKFDPKAGSVCSGNTEIRSGNVWTGTGFLLGGLLDLNRFPKVGSIGSFSSRRGTAGTGAKFWIEGLGSTGMLLEQGMYKNRVENGRIFLKFLLLYLANEEIQQKTEWENSKYICCFEFSYSGFSRSQDKRAGI